MQMGGDRRSRHVRKQAAAVTALAVCMALGSSPANAEPQAKHPETRQTPTLGHRLAELSHGQSDQRSRVPRDVRLVRTRTSLLGRHLWYRQVWHGHFVVGAWYARHINKSGKVTVWDGRKSVAKVTPARAVISAAQAEAMAGKAAPTKPLQVSTERPMVLPTGTGAAGRLVWPVNTVTGKGATTAYVDAGTGRILKTVSSPQMDSQLSHKPSSLRGRGRVFDPNPVVALQNENLADHNDSASAVPKSAYRTVALPRLDHSHSLVGRWVKIVNRNLARSKTNRYLYYRSNDRFEQVSAYHAVDAEQNYLQSLGFHDVNAQQQKVKVDAFPDDNSFYNPATQKISLGRGGVDDAEDPEVVWHEYGHAIQSDQVLDFGWTQQAKAIGEGFGDYMAVTMSQLTAKDTKLTPLACVMDWDATAYTPKAPHCLRRTDLNLIYPKNLTGEPHADGQIWSRALWDMNRELGRNKATKIIIEAQSWMNPKVTMPTAAQITVATARKLYGDTTGAVAHRAFARRGIL